MAFEVGTTTGGYEFIDIIHNDPKTGITYKVRNVKFGRLEMLRILPLNLQGDQEKVNRFLREVKVHARLSHPNIITFYNATEIEGQMVMTMQLVEGTPLAARLELGRLPYATAIDYMRQVLSALGSAHKQGIVHRDVTPANILITPDRRAMLGGFGMAKGGSDPNLTQTGTAVGMAQYMSPEQVKGVTALDGRSDLYSAGVVLYEAVTGQVPFTASSHFEVMLAHVNCAPKAPCALNPELPEGFNDVLLKALAKDPAKRFQAAAEFIETLDALESTVQAETAVKTAAAVAVMKPPAETHSHSGSSQPASLAAASGIALPRMPAPTPDGVAAALKPQRWPFATGGREWTWGELILAGILASALGSLFVALMTGMLHVPGAR